MTKDEFIEEVFEIAFGDNAINRDFSREEVINQLRKESEESYLLEQIIELINEALKVEAVQTVLGEVQWK